MTYTVECAYSLKRRDESVDRLDLIAASHHGQNIGSGVGFGQRDMEWEFATLEQAQACAAEMAKLDLVYLVVTITYKAVE